MRLQQITSVSPEEAQGWMEILIQQKYASLIIGLLLGLIFGLIVYNIIIRRGWVAAPITKAAIAEDEKRKQLWAENAKLSTAMAEATLKIQHLSETVGRLEKDLEPWLKFKEQQVDAALNAKRIGG